MNIAGVVLSLMLIFKAKYMNLVWIPTNALLNWRFLTSNSSWTFDSYEFKWLIIVFELNIWPKDLRQQCLLIMDGHNSHMTTNFIVHCMKHAIDLFILFLHTSHLFQPLDVSVFAPLKHALAEETDTISKHDSGCISHVD